MSWNNIVPAWIYAEFNTHFNNFKEGKITLEEFVSKIEPLPEVPEVVKENWRNKINGNGTINV